MKPVDIGEKRKPCPYCGAKLACPDFTCPRIASITFYSDDEWQIDFVEDWQPDRPDPAA